VHQAADRPERRCPGGAAGADQTYRSRAGRPSVSSSFACPCSVRAGHDDRMKEARARYPQLGNNLWVKAHPLGAKVLARFAGPGPRLPGRSPEQKAPWALRSVLPVAGEGRRRPFWLNDLRKHGGKPRWAREGRVSTRKCWSLQPAHPRARDRRCLSQTDRDNGQSTT